MDSVPDEIKPEFTAYFEARKKSKTPMTERAVTLALKELEKLATGDYEKQRQIIDQTVMWGWKGFFPLKEPQAGGPAPQKYQYPENGDKDGESL